MASRIAARSTTAGTPVKSCMSTRAGVKAISSDGLGVASQVASASMSSRAHADAVLVAQQVLEQDLERERQPRDIEARLQGVEPIDHVLAPADARAWRERRRSSRSCP